MSKELPYIIPPASSGVVGTAYSFTYPAVLGTLQPPTWKVTSGALPPGLALSTNGSGYPVISGTPTSFGAFSYSITGTDAVGTVGVPVADSISVQGPPLLRISPNPNFRNPPVVLVGTSESPPAIVSVPV